MKGEKKIRKEKNIDVGQRPLDRVLQNIDGEG